MPGMSLTAYADAYDAEETIITVSPDGNDKENGAFMNTKKNVIIKVKTSAKNFEKNKKLLEKPGLPKNATVKRVKKKK